MGLTIKDLIITNTINIQMNKLDQLIDLHEELDSPHEPIRKQVQIKYDALYIEIQGLIDDGQNLRQLISLDVLQRDGVFVGAIDLESQVAKLKDEQGMMFNHRGVIAKLREKDDFNLSMIAKLKEELEELLAKHEGNTDTKSDISKCIGIDKQ